MIGEVPSYSSDDFLVVVDGRRSYSNILSFEVCLINLTY